MLIPKTSRGQSCTSPKMLIHVYYFSISTWLEMISLAVVCGSQFCPDIPKAVVNLFQSAAHFHIEDFLQTASTDS